ncbi:uncharacterized protein LOC133650130 [Entelurus aequoreus]|uniref:uncharacterized protein LOC133650130 n=1 Tax=Entelurus aequoreus TaxID=161455 RepID=UPI002B1D7C0D|nr:uncharacterized protein LOC133650130 [Entelurus aequoreus]
MLPAKLTVVALLASVWCCTSQELRYSVACGDANLILQCPDRHVVRVKELRYGKADRVNCAAITPATADFSARQYCLNPGLKTWTAFICNGLQRCRLPKPNPQMFVCDENHNFIQVSYYCRKQRSAEHTVVACEGKTAALTCDAGKSIRIMKASYGRFDERRCSKTSSIMTFCSSPSAHGIVADKFCSLLTVRTGMSGMVCDFDVFQGSVNGIGAKSELGLSGDDVFELASTLPEGQNYTIYADNYFASVPLLVKLLDRGID